MPRRVTLSFPTGDSLAMRQGTLVEAGATVLSVRLDASEAEPDLPTAPSQPIVAVVHAPNAHTASGAAPGTAFLLTTRLPGDDPTLVRLAHAGHQP
jgi:hypothetical protein